MRNNEKLNRINLKKAAFDIAYNILIQLIVFIIIECACPFFISKITILIQIVINILT